VANQYGSILEGFWGQVASHGGKAALASKKNGQWTELPWTLVGEKVARLASAFKKMGLQKGDKVAIFSENCPEWVINDFACMAAGLVSVPLYATQTDEQVQYIIGHSEAKAVLVRGDARVGKVTKIETLQKIIVIDGHQSDAGAIISFDKFLEQGSPDWNRLSQDAKSLNMSALSTIVYTSGTTANPKGVMLTHQNNYSESDMLAIRSLRRPDDIILSFLPLSHITERMNLYRQAMLGYTIYFSQSLETVAQDLKEVRPTSLVAVPRLWEKFQEGILAKAKDAPPGKKKILDKTLALGRADFEARQKGTKIGLGSRIRLRILQRLVGNKLKAALGFDRCQHFVSGAAPLSIETIIFFYALGIRIFEGYGLTECSGASHLNDAFNPAYGTVGPAIDGMECKIASDGEILLKGPNVFIGYYKDPEQTAEVLKGGWFHTGDIGVVDSKGCLRITDRKKNIIVTSGGKNVAPAPLEAKLKKHPMISQVVVIGDKRKYLSALFTLVPGVKSVDAKPALAAHVEELNRALPSYETIKTFSILDKDFGVETGELTPTLKAKRGFIQEKYKNVIDTMYA
jgi:long-chain acyl-CoA synthetase